MSRSSLLAVGACVAVLVLLLGMLPASTLTARGSGLAGPDPRDSALVRPGGALHPAGSVPTWTDLTTNASPPPRNDGGLVWDGEDGYVLLFGGEFLNTTTFSETYYNDTWTFVGGVWTNISGTVAPSPRFGFGLAYDVEDGVVVLFGGRDAAGAALSDTWEFSGGRWTNVTAFSVHTPASRFWAGMTYDSSDGYVLLFGGYGSTANRLGDTWHFLGGSWSQATPTTSPTARSSPGLADDPTDGYVLLFGGLDSVIDQNDTWSYSGGTWTQLTPATTPDARTGPGFSSYTFGHSVVMYGGYPSSTYPFGTWVYSSGNWVLSNNLPNAPSYAGANGYGQQADDVRDSWVVYLVPDSNETAVFNYTASGSPFHVTSSAAPLSGPVGLTVALNANATGGTPPYNYTWALGDGRSVYGPAAGATYSAPGTYNLTLTATDSAAGRSTRLWTVNVSASSPLGATATVAPDPQAVGGLVYYNATVAGGTLPYAFSWSFGDGASASSQNSTHRYLTAGTYIAAFVVHDATGAAVFVNATETILSTTPSPLTLTASAIPVSGTAPLLVSLAALASGGTAPYTYSWSFGDGTSASSSENGSHTYAAPGTFTLNLKVDDSGTQSAQENWTITVAPAPLTVTISATPAQTVVGSSVQFASTVSGGTAPFSYAWTFGDGATSTDANPSHSFQSAGTFNVTLKVTDGAGASASRWASVTVTGGSAGTSSSGSWLSNVWLWLVIIIVLGAILLFVVISRRRRKPAPAAASAAPSAKDGK